MIKHRKDNYFIYQGQSKNTDKVGITIVYHQEMLKQVGKIALDFPLAASEIFGYSKYKETEIKNENLQSQLNNKEVNSNNKTESSTNYDSNQEVQDNSNNEE